MSSEEAKVIEAENSTEVLTAFNRIPYALINAEVSSATKDTLDASSTTTLLKAMLIAED